MFWALADTKKLSRKEKDVITNPGNQIIISTISFWEVSLKASLGKLEIHGFSPEDLPGACIEIGFDIQPLTPEDSSTYHKLMATYHKDPFDRMLIWQAIRNNYTLISADSNARKYVSEGLKIFDGK
jgi:PIN domain nuclease of toxin-antitoxin system